MYLLFVFDIIWYCSVPSHIYLIRDRHMGMCRLMNPTIRVDSIIKCVLHCIRQEKMYGSLLQYPWQPLQCTYIISCVAKFSEQWMDMLSVLRVMYIMCLYIITTAFYLFFCSHRMIKENVKIMMVSNSSLYQRNEAFNSKQWSCISGYNGERAHVECWRSYWWYYIHDNRCNVNMRSVWGYEAASVV